MTREEAIEIILEEKLSNYNLNEDRENNEDEVVIKSRDNMWAIYATDERASKVPGSEKIFENEETAWDNLIKRLRAGKRLRNSYADTN
ncbi:hypothetical protein EDD66_103117 [Mobilisporobacter senegalensis]|uniref:Uncharacterized protein n=1 Tax=Mobilisporobacter senegalensis TaxID=1329262 RepID=A0A3N1XVH3_9FIRM|nr:hypothetical protein [Mobilisporobacter senegalensis]ROR29182.1 hypothetical protein EDD66_103117 [Mobilisporobacter senegalensis]